MADLNRNKESSSPVGITGSDENSIADVKKSRLLVDSRIEGINGAVASISNFSEIRNVEREIDVEAKFYYNISTRSYTTAHLNGGSAAATNSQAVLQTSTSTNGRSFVRTRKTVDYRVSQDIEFSHTLLFPSLSGTPGSQVGFTNSTQHVGVIDRSNQNGIYIGFNNNETFSIFYRKDGVETKINQSSFSHDKLDASTITNGKVSEYAPDWTKIQLVRCVFSWHGASPFIFQIEKPNGEWLTYHVESFVNSRTTPSIANPIMSLFAEIKNTGNATNLSLVWQAGQASFLGKSNPLSGSRFFSVESINIVQAQTPVLTIRSRDLFASKTNFILSSLDYLSLNSDGNKFVTFRLYKNATLVGSSFTNIDTNNSVVEFDTSSTSFSGGEFLLTIRTQSVGSFNQLVKDLNIQLEPLDTLTVTAQSQSSNDVNVGFRWREFH